jgi:predicted PurR-regulated permease PerM
VNIDRKKSVNLLLIVFLVLSIWLFSSFLAAIVFGAFLTFIFSPLQDRFTFIKDKDYRSAFITFLTIFIILLIIYFITQSFFFKIDNSINTIQKYARGEITTCEGDFLCDIVIKFDALRDDITAQRYLSDIFNSKNKSGSGFLENSFNIFSKFILLLPDLMLFLFLTFLSMWYFLSKKLEIYKAICKLSPLNSKDTKNLFKEFHNLLKGFTFGFLLTAFIQAIIAGFAYYLANIEYPIVFGILTGLLGSIPFLGTGLIWMPLLIFKVLFGMSTGIPYFSDAIIIFIGGVIVGSIDNIIKPKVMANLVLIDVYFIILGVLGGLSIFGLSGLIIGPFIVIITYNLMKIYFKMNKANGK